jgi:hypothetical protein
MIRDDSKFDRRARPSCQKAPSSTSDRDFEHGLAFIRTHQNALLRQCGSISEHFVVSYTIEQLLLMAKEKST